MTLFQGGQLDTDRCQSLLARSSIGRVGLVVGPLPFIYPVRYAVREDRIDFAVPFEHVAAAVAGATVALQADGFDEDEGCHWTVLVIGPACAFTPGAGPARGSGRPEPRAFSLRPTMFSGHWLDHTGTPIE